MSAWCRYSKWFQITRLRNQTDYQLFLWSVSICFMDKRYQNCPSVTVNKALSESESAITPRKRISSPRIKIWSLSTHPRADGKSSEAQSRATCFKTWKKNEKNMKWLLHLVPYKSPQAPGAKTDLNGCYLHLFWSQSLHCSCSAESSRSEVGVRWR